jgi:hypothetical protein
MPSLSRAHFRKHEGVKHFLVSEEIVEVAAEYDDVEAYIEAHRWFGWTKDELGAQTLKWPSIRPGIEFGGYPAIGDISAVLKKQVVFGGNAKPRLEIDREKLLSLMRGANIYAGPFDSMREVIQNSVDATLLRLSLELQSAKKDKPRNASDLRDLVEKYPIEITFDKRPDEDLAGPQLWMLKVIDNGIGMTRADIQRLLSVGSTPRPTFHAVILDWLPEYARPSGAFGIGFKSLFQFCKDVRVTSRHPYERETLRVEFSRANLIDDPAVVVTCDEDKESEIRPSPGTIVEAVFELERLPTIVNVFGSSIVSEALRKYDQLVDDELPHLCLRIKHDLYAFALDSVCRLVVDGDTPMKAGKASEARTFFCGESGVELCFKHAGLADGRVETLYRGVAVENRFRAPIVSFQANIMSGNSIDLVTLSRNKWTGQGEERVSTVINETLPVAVAHWMKKSEFSSDELALLSLFNALHTGDYRANMRWRSIVFCDDVTLTDLADAAVVDIQILDGSFVNKAAIEGSKSSKTVTLRFIELDRIGGSWLAKFLAATTTAVEIAAVDERYIRYVFSKGPGPVFEIKPEPLVALFLDAIPLVGQRVYVHCPDRYSDLSTSNVGGLIWWRDAFFSKRMINPFYRRSRSDKLMLGNLRGYVMHLVKGENRELSVVCIALHELGEELWSSTLWKQEVGLSQKDFFDEIDHIKKLG